MVQQRPPLHVLLDWLWGPRQVQTNWQAQEERDGARRERESLSTHPAQRTEGPQHRGRQLALDRERGSDERKDRNTEAVAGADVTPDLFLMASQ